MGNQSAECGKWEILTSSCSSAFRFLVSSCSADFTSISTIVTHVSGPINKKGSVCRDVYE
jgi:hypothetical protein